MFRAGAAATDVDPPLGLPMVGVVRRDEPARGRLGSLEVTAADREPPRIAGWLAAGAHPVLPSTPPPARP